MGPGRIEPLAFHGILPRGCIEMGGLLGLDHEAWPWMGAFLELTLGDATGERQACVGAAIADGLRTLEAVLGELPPALDAEQGRRWLDAAIATGFVSHAEARELVKRLLCDCGAHEPVARCLKEGHTSSVWRVEAGVVPGMPALAVLVPRDRVGGSELESTTGEMERLARLQPASVASVRERRRLSRRHDRPVPIVVMDWVHGARELHVVRSPEERRGCVVAVSEFLNAAPAEGVGQWARVEDSVDSGGLWRSIVELRTELAFLSGPDAGLVTLPAFEPNEGDLVATNDGVAVVGCSLPSTVTAAEAVHDLLLTSALDDGPGGGSRLAGGEMRTTVEAVWSGITRALGPIRAAEIMSEARAAADGETATALATHHGHRRLDEPMHVLSLVAQHPSEGPEL